MTAQTVLIRSASVPTATIPATAATINTFQSGSNRFDPECQWKSCHKLSIGFRSGESGGRRVSDTLAGTSNALAVGNPAPSQISTA